ncbi:UDP-N-acetylglucosamine diphosphorylase/glucosamine-1-phosphate N-acetyltransferase [Nautilia sp. PV-1]|uniref:bifunctional UDP-N-acetylglucosamine diphosphorylase/glucosamine-1-phosphate N-acetyltransferase GlmU n=1 Tax=Nautilia sp. PV-1 TaxID=2579250 RepID=UPI000FDC6AD5|nr:bifunctional UDP-N-acetylglucosamine diphosphorylase/glucosamine-1-phosphate N-acetyltransferase GlmU [Nautilia sp. PV-1]AZV46830.1 UDP-N-acetylglucosamine diphosphorylase/glucosamine-1-phosphate N-acetyltransferase [Nautilia sp. PV-1]
MLQIIILAAGKGTRMKSPTAKVLHKLCGKSMIEYIIEESLKLTDKIDIILNHQFDKVSETVNAYPVNIIKQDLENFPGTGGAVKEVPLSADKVLVLNGDMPLIKAEELKKFEEIDADIVMSVMKLDNPDGYGRVVIKEGKVEKIVEQKDANEEELKIPYVNAGVYLFKKAVLEKYLPKLSNNNKQKEYYLTDIIEMASKDALTIKAVEVDEENFKGVNSKKDLAHAEEIMCRRIKNFWMQNGVIMHLPDTIYIDAYSSFEGECEIGNGCVIKKSVIIESEIRPLSVIEEAVIKKSGVGPMARIRPKSELTDTHIGNFVEVKASKLKGIKAGHLSYLGDSEIDEGTNIGAGTITCNYDGKAKYKTKIGKNVFVGSDTQLIAPVTIEDDVMIAAGSTVNKDIKKGSLAISRAPLKIIKNFYYKFFGRQK